MRIVFSVEYDGSGFCGWQHQPSECSLQDVIQNSIEKFSGQHIKITGSSRTPGVPSGATKATSSSVLIVRGLLRSQAPAKSTHMSSGLLSE